MMAKETTEQARDRLRLCSVTARYLGEALSPETLKVCAEDCERGSRNLLFESFGETRYERVVHEFLASILANSDIRPVALRFLQALIEPFGQTIVDADDWLVETEIVPGANAGVRVDIVVRNCDQNWELGIELKVGALLTGPQLQGYSRWVKRTADRFLIFVGLGAQAEETTHLGPRVQSWTWSQLGRALEGSMNTGGKLCPIFSGREGVGRRRFLSQFAKGLAKMQGDMVEFSNLSTVLKDAKHAAAISLADEDDILRRLGVDPEAVAALEKTAALAAQEADAIVRLAGAKLVALIEGRVAKKPLEKKTTGLQWELEFPILKKGAHWTPKRKAPKVYVSLDVDGAQKPALLLYVMWPADDAFADLDRTVTADAKEARKIWGVDTRARVLGKVILLKKGKKAGAFKDLETIVREFESMAKAALLKGGQKSSALKYLCEASAK